MHTAVNVTHLTNDSLMKLSKYLSYFMREMIYQLSEIRIVILFSVEVEGVITYLPRNCVKSITT